MADFHTHVSTSSVLGVGYAGMGLVMGLNVESAIVGGGLCGVSGMLPDLDSDSGIPIREATGFAAGIVPMLLVDRFRAFDFPYDRMVLITALLYFLIRFAGASLLGRFTVHRGMFHSVPAGLIFAGLAFLICGPEGDYQVRYFKAGAVFFGFMSHLFLDEIYSISWRGGIPRMKRSFGTAIKLWGKSGWANFSTYAKLAVVAILVAGEPSVMTYLKQRYPEFADRVQRLHEAKDDFKDRVRERVNPGQEPSDNNQFENVPAGNSPTVASRSDHSATGSENTSSRYMEPVQPRDSQVPPFNNGWPNRPGMPQPVEESFSPNSGQSFGTAEPVYRASGNFIPR